MVGTKTIQMGFKEGLSMAMDGLDELLISLKKKSLLNTGIFVQN